MARYTEAKCRLCRREGAKLFIKGARCITEKCPFVKRPNPPGIHTRMMRKPSYYSLQLREKQKVKRMYGMLEKQFRRFFNLAESAKGVTGRNLIQLLESRLDNTVFRSLFASSRNQARQIVLHGFIHLNGRKVNVPSCFLREGDEILVKNKDGMRNVIKDNIASSAKDRSVPSWLEVDKDNLKIKVLRLPEKEDLVLPVNEQLIIELYSK
ncbi:MAG: 30S ribosomal protein S4 [Candidatus Omnitrophica bacterium]|nr:30S ribosomal protein S4 [Candidatus Omnitrophota bacterium]